MTYWQSCLDNWVWLSRAQLSPLQKGDFLCISQFCLIFQEVWLTWPDSAFVASLFSSALICSKREEGGRSSAFMWLLIPSSFQFLLQGINNVLYSWLLFLNFWSMLLSLTSLLSDFLLCPAPFRGTAEIMPTVWPMSPSCSLVLFQSPVFSSVTKPGGLKIFLFAN